MAVRDDGAGREVSLDAVLAELKRGQSVPCYLLCGDEEFLLRSALEKITARLIPDAQDRELNLFQIEGENEEIDAICDSLLTPPLLPGPKVVVVRNTRLFQSRNVLGPLIDRIRERIGQDPQRAASDFMQFLAITGLQLDDLRDGGWRRIDDEDWRRVVPDDSGQEREKWLPLAVELCLSVGSSPVSERTEDADRLAAVLNGQMPAGNHLILTAEAVDRRKKIFKTISGVGRVLSFARIKGAERQQTAVQEMAAGLLGRVGKHLTAGAWTALGLKTGFSLRESMGAIEKLITYAGARPRIEEADVEAVVGRTKEDTVFELTGALAGRDVKRALQTLHELLDQGEVPLMVMAMITREIRFLFQAKLLIESGRFGAFLPDMDYGRFQKGVYPAIRKTAEDGKEAIALASQHPFVVFQALKNAGRFTRAELAGDMELLARTDLALKSTGSEPRLLLERLLIAACGQREPRRKLAGAS